MCISEKTPKESPKITKLQMSYDYFADMVIMGESVTQAHAWICDYLVILVNDISHNG